MADVRQGQPRTTPSPGSGPSTGWPGGTTAAASRSTFDPAPDDVDEGRRVTWTATVAPGESFTVRLTFAADGTPALGPGGPAPWGEVAVDAPDVRLPRLVRQSLADLGGLLMQDGDDAFVAAGAPWFLTLFGRDSLWVARLLMPFTHRAGALDAAHAGPSAGHEASTRTPRSSPARSCTRSATPPSSSAG